MPIVPAPARRCLPISDADPSTLVTGLSRGPTIDAQDVLPALQEVQARRGQGSRTAPARLRLLYLRTGRNAFPPSPDVTSRRPVLRDGRVSCSDRSTVSRRAASRLRARRGAESRFA
jgi:hypothetical protein